jgi:ATP-dependent RNA helicase RhlE
MPSDITRLSREVLIDPIRVEVSPRVVTVEKIDQRVFFIDTGNKRALLTHLLQDAGMNRVLIFMRTKRGANRLAEQLEKAGFPTEAIHGNKTQSARQSALAQFRNGRARILVATDVAARGIDISGVSHVVNYELPNIPESYVHRVGRTARAGAGGVALSFCDSSERAFLRNIERVTKRPITVVDNHPHRSAAASRGPSPSKPSAPGRSGSRRRGASGPSRPGKRRGASGENAPKRQDSPGGPASNGSKPKRQGLSGERTATGGAAPSAPRTRRKRRPRRRPSAA